MTCAIGTFTIYKTLPGAIHFSYTITLTAIDIYIYTVYTRFLASQI